MYALDIYQLLPTISVGNEWGQQMRIQFLILGFKWLSTYLWYWLLQHLGIIQNILVNHV